MPVRKTLLILMLIIPIITACSAGNGYKAGHQGDQAEARALPSEKAFYKESDAGTEVFRMTSDQGNDSIFYQEPNYFSPDSSKFKMLSAAIVSRVEFSRSSGSSITVPRTITCLSICDTSSGETVF